MTRRGLACAGLALCALLAGCASTPRGAGAEPPPPPAEQSDWQYGQSAGRRILTPHYELYTTVTDANLLAALPGALESAFAAYQSLQPDAAAPARRMPVFLFLRREEWEHFTKAFAGPRAALLLKIRAGGYMERGVTVVEYLSHQTTFPILAHEGLHQYLHHTLNRTAPAWLNEGLATQFEGQRFSRTGAIEFDARLNPLRRNALAEALVRDELLPLPELLTINAGHVVGGATRRIAAYYAQLWGLLLYLREGADGRYLAGLQTALSALRRGNSAGGAELFRAHIADDLDAFEAEFRTFLRTELLRAPGSPRG